MTSFRKYCISKFVKELKLLSAEKIWNILAFDRKSLKLTLILTWSFIKNNDVYDFRFEIFILSKWEKLFDFKKTAFRCYEFLNAMYTFLCGCG